MASQINVLSELERYRLKYVYAGDDEVKIRCPFHDDKSPSCDVSLSKRVFNCHAASCGETGTIIELLAKAANQPVAVILEELSSRYDLDDVKIVDPEVVERWHSRIWGALPLLGELRKRGITDEIIKKRKLGEDGGRVTIPVYNERGAILNVRRYLPGAPGADKMRNMRGRGSAQWYPHGQLRYDEIVICGGEMKALVMAEACNPHKVGAACMTVNEGLLPAKLLEQLRGKAVHVLFDIDGGGRSATRLNLRALMSVAAEIYDATAILCSKLDLTKHPTGDVNDYLATGGDLWSLIVDSRAAGEWKPPENRDDETEPESSHLSHACNAKNAGRRLCVSGVVTAMDTAPYIVPREITVSCDRSYKFCSLCPVWPSPDGEFEIGPEQPAVLEAIAADSSTLHSTIMNGIGIPRQCKVCSFKTRSYHNAEEVRLSPTLEITSNASDQRSTPAVCIGPGLELNEPYEFTGRMWPHPRSQQSTLLISSYRQTKDALSTYAPIGADLEALRAFRPREWSEDALHEQLHRLYSDIEQNVTRIRDRRSMHLFMDLVWHSPLLLTISGRPVKGWAEVLVVGDSAQGKSETASGLMRHYGLGEKLECKNATAAGLLGGLQPMGSRWIVSWGFIPTHDRRMVHLEELKGASIEAISKLTEMRSSGVAELTKIEKRRTHARTRLLATSNPRPDGRTIGSYAFGLECIKELIGGLEDVRRFDACYIAASTDVDPDVINRPWPDSNAMLYPPGLCRSLVLWAWTRTASQVAVDDSVVELLGQRGAELSKEYSDVIPVVDAGSARYKLARLAAALACRTFSSSDDGLSVILRPCHVEYIVGMLREHYSSKAFGYKDFTEAVWSSQQLIDRDAVKSAIAALPFPYDFVESLLRCERMEVQDLQDWCGWDRLQASQMLSLLVRKHALRRDGKTSYRKTGQFIEFLRSVQNSRAIPGRPDFIPESEF